MSSEQSFPVSAYLVDGRAVRVQGRLHGKYVVEIGYEDGDEVHYQGLETVDKVFDKPPVEAVEARIQALLSQEKQLRDSASVLRSQQYDAERSVTERLKYLKQFEPLALLEDFLAGRITHFVICDYSKVVIKPRDEALSTKDDYDRWSKELKLLTLFGRDKTGLQWRLNRYSDGSGGNIDVFPCTSLEAAQAKAADIVAARFEELRGKTGYPHGIDYAIGSAKGLGLPIPADIQAIWDAGKAKNKAERISKLEAELAAVRAES